MVVSAKTLLVDEGQFGEPLFGVRLPDPQMSANLESTQRRLMWYLREHLMLVSHRHGDGMEVTRARVNL